MVESGPFIEYCCELYIHHDLVNAVVAAVMIFSALLNLAVISWALMRNRKRNEDWLEAL